MKRIPTFIVFLTTIAPAVAAETTERTQSLPDAYPACMQVNGPDCVLKSQAVPPPTVAPQGVTVVPTPVPPLTTAPGATTIIVPAPPITTTTTTTPGATTITAPAQRSIIISPRP